MVSVTFDRYGKLVLKKAASPTPPASNNAEVYVGTSATFFKQYDKQRIEAFKKAKKNKKRIPLPPSHL